MLTNINGALALSIMKNEIRAHGKVDVKVLGISMMPTLQEEDIVTVSLPRKYKPGDIIIFMAHYEKMIIHRIISIEHGRFITKGDNNKFFDEEFDTSTIVGKVDYWYRNGKTMCVSENSILIKMLICISHIEVKYPSAPIIYSIKKCLLSTCIRRIQ